MTLPNMTAGALRRALSETTELLDSDELAKNAVGNLAVLRDGDYIGYIDLRYAEVTLFTDDEVEQ